MMALRTARAVGYLSIAPDGAMFVTLLYVELTLRDEG
jgi:hypothetical protein